MGQPKSKVLSSFVWSFLEQGGANVISLFVQLILARLLDPAAFGVMAILLILVSVASTITQSGFGAALIQKQDSSERSFTTAWWISFLFASILYGVIFVTAPFVSELYEMPDLVAYLRVIALILFFDAFNGIQRSFLQKEMEFKALFKSSTVAILISGIAGVGSAFLGWGVWALVIQSMVQAIVSCFLMLIQVSWRPSFCFDRDDARGLFSYGWKICATGVLNTLYTGVSELILGKVCSAADLGLYSQGRKWPGAAVSIITNSLQNVLFPAFSELSTDLEMLRKAIDKALTVGCYLVVPFTLFLAVAAEPIVSLLLTEKWIECVPVFQLVCIQNVGLIMGLVNLRSYMALGHADLYLKLQIVKVSTGIVIICGIAVVFHDIVWVAAASCVHGLFCTAVDITPARNVHGLGAFTQLRRVLPLVVLALGSSVVSYCVSALPFGDVLTVVCQAVVFFLIYFSFSALFKVPGFTECVDVVTELIKRK